MKQFILLVFLIAHADTLVLAQIHGLVKDINTTGRYNGLKVSETCAVGNVLYMAADDGLNGTELWKSDGTPEGTQMVKNLHSRDRQFLFPPRTLTNINGTLYFYGFTGGAFFLFKTDGTDRGTTVVKEVGDRAYDRGGNLLAIGNSIYFTSDGGLGTELWKTDGTQEGTVLVKDLVPGYEAGNPGDFVEFKGNLYFYTYDYFYRPYTLWKSDGTAEGTEVVGVSGAFRMPLKVANGNLYYVTYMGRRLGVPIYTLRRTNGIASEIIVRQDVYALDNLTVVGNTLFFTAVALHAGVELWKTDGSVAGTQLVKDINPATEVSSDPGGLVRVGNRLYFTASDGTHGRELWQSGGTSANTSMIADINPGEGDAHITGLTAVGTAAAFSADDGTGRRLWKSDGLAAGTQVLSDTDATWLTDVNGLLYFNGLTDNGLQIFKSNMEPGGTSVITSISRPASVPMNFVQLNGVGYFTADDAFHGRELWRSDGKSAGTYLVKDITPGADSSAISNLVNIAGSLYFTLPVTATGASLWKSDGTQAGTVLLKGVFSQMPADSIQGLTNVDGTLFFGVYTDGMMGLWKSDGTNEGTVLVKGGLKTFFAPVTLNGILYFGAYDGINSAELWKSDGTEAGTVAVTELVVKDGGMIYASLVVASGKLFFLMDEPYNHYLLVVSDGSTAGTEIVYDFGPENRRLLPGLTSANGYAYFSTVFDDFNLEEFRRTDGTSAGTVQLGYFDTDTYYGSFQQSRIHDRRVVGDKLLFVPKIIGEGDQLWQTNGTPEGTGLVKAITGLGAYSEITHSVVVNSLLYFTNDDGINGNEIWQSDGTEAGTRLAYDITPGGSSVFWQLGTMNNKLLISANSGEFGMELYKYIACVNPELPMKNTMSTDSVENVREFLDGTSCTVIASVSQTAGAGGAGVPVSGPVSARVWLSEVPQVHFVQRHYEIKPLSGAENSTARITLYFSQKDFDVYNAVNILKLPVSPADPEHYKPNLLIHQYAGTSIDASGLPSSYAGARQIIDPEDESIVWINNRWEITFDVEGFSGFFVSTTPDPLPVTLVNFDAKKQEDHVLLSWSTADETDQEGFIIQRSPNTKVWEEIGFVKSESKAAQLTDYSFTDDQPLNATSYYRLKMADKSRKYTYSQIRSIGFSSIRILLYPNPAAEVVTIQSADTILKITVISPAGQILKSIVPESYKQQFHVNLADLPSGSYLIQLDLGKKKETLKLVK